VIGSPVVRFDRVAVADGPIQRWDLWRIDAVWRRSYGGSAVPVLDRSAPEEPGSFPMTDRIRRAWGLALAVAPFVAVALVEAAMRRW
jgi:hypothetical protein